MNSIFHENGIIVQDLNDAFNCQNLGSYIGVGRYISWPLSRKTDDLSKRLSVEAEEKWFSYYYGESYALSVVPSIEYIERYIEVCNQQGIRVRLLYIQSDREMPKWEGTELRLKLLGYEYASSQDFFSVLFDDLYGAAVPSILTKYKSVLNSNGLFSNEADLLAYIKDRNLAIEKNFNLEPHGDFCIYRVSLVMD